MDYLTELGLIGLFIAAFLSATILPLSSEIILTALLLNNFPPVTLIMVATAGNTLGSLSNYALGYWAGLPLIKRWLKLSDHTIITAEQRFKNYGLFSLCFAWLPIIGDPLTVIAGVLRVRLLWFVLLVAIGKGMRYWVVASFFNEI